MIAMEYAQAGITCLPDSSNRPIESMARNATDEGSGFLRGIRSVPILQLAPSEVSLRSFWRSDSCRWIVVNCRIRLNSEAEQPGDEETLAHRILFCQPPHS